MSADRLSEAHFILCVARDVFIKHHRYQNAPIDLLVDRLLASPNLPMKNRALGTDVPPEVFDLFKQRHALAAAYEESCFTLIEVALQQGDISPILRGFVKAFKERVSRRR